MDTTVDLPIDNVAATATHLADLQSSCDVETDDDEFSHEQWMVGYYPTDLMPIFRRLSVCHRGERPVLSVRVDGDLPTQELGVVLHALHSKEPITTPEWKIPFRVEDQTYVLTISREFECRVDEEGKDTMNPENAIPLGYDPAPPVLSGLNGGHAGSSVDVHGHLRHSSSVPGEDSALFRNGEFPKTDSRAVFTYQVAALQGNVVEANITGKIPIGLKLKTPDLLRMRIALKEYLTQKYGSMMPDRVWYEVVVDPNNETVTIDRFQWKIQMGRVS